MSSPFVAPKSLPHLLEIVLTGCFAGALVSVAGCHWLLWEHEEDQLATCDDAYEECLSYAVSEADKELCEDDVRFCYEACEAGWDEDEQADDSGDSGSGDSGDGDGDSGSGDSGSGDADSGDTGEDPGVCIDLFGACIDGAETLQDVEACELLYEQCVNPGECPEPECGCPADELEACLDSYASCAALADAPEKVAACEASFDACTAPFADECPMDENPKLGLCLEQHELCVACAQDDAQLGLCQVVFESCMSS